MPTMDAEALRNETDGLAALRRTLGGIDELCPPPGEARPDMYRPRNVRPSTPPDAAGGSARVTV